MPLGTPGAALEPAVGAAAVAAVDRGAVVLGSSTWRVVVAAAAVAGRKLAWALLKMNAY